MRNLHVHLGPHKTGSTSIQAFLRDHVSTDILTARDALYVTDPLVKQLGTALQAKDWDAASAVAKDLQDLLLLANAREVFISSEDLSGGLVGRGRVRRVYPRLFENVKLIDDALGDIFECTYYFFVRDEDDWLRSVYNQNLKHRASATDFDKFANGIRGHRSWPSVLRKAQDRFGDRFVALPYTRYTEGSVVQRFADAAMPRLLVKKDTYSMYQENKAPDPQIVQALEVVNKSYASVYAKRNARKYLTTPSQKSADEGIATSTSASEDLAQNEEHAGDWPPNPVRPNHLADELSALWDRTELRVRSQEPPNLLPDLSTDFKQACIDLTEGEEAFPGGGRHDMHQQDRILRHRFRGLPLVCFYNAFAISYLRRSTPHTQHAKRLFCHLWENEYRIMLATLPTRWLISVLQTFMEHGTSEAQRHVGTAGFFFSNTMKAYEAERGLEGHPADNIYAHTEPSTKNGFPGLDRFALGNTDLMLNLLAQLLEASARDDVSGRVLRELLLRTRAANTLFSRMDQSRIHHKADKKGFENCWSFFEEPDRRK